MNQQNVQPQYIEEDTIDLRELWNTLVKRKWTIIAFTVIATAAAAFYAWNATPVYKGDVLIEVGDMIINTESTNDKPTVIQSLDNPNDLKEAVLQSIAATDREKKDQFSVESPKGSSKLIKISYENTDTQQIQQKLEHAVAYVLKRHEIKAAFFQKANAQIRPSAIIGSINITPDPIKPKKGLIVAVGFISGLMLGIFLAFFLEFIRNGRKEEI